MKASLPKRLGLALLRAALIFLAFNLIFLLARTIFAWSLLEEGMLSPRALGAWNTAFLFFIFESTVFAFHRHRADARQAFWDTCANRGFSGILRSVCTSPDLYVEYGTVVLLSLGIPLSFACVGEAFFGEGFTTAQTMAVSLPILLVMELVAHLSVRCAWGADGSRAHASADGQGGKKRAPFSPAICSVGFAALVYCAAAVMIPWFLPFLITLGNLGGGAMVFLYAAVAAVAACLAVVSAYCLRAVRKRKEFVARLKRYCAEQDLTLSEIRAPCRSLFALREGVDFTLEANGQIFACKLVGSLFPGSPMIFADTGEGLRRDTLRLFRVDLLQLHTRLDYRMKDAPAGSTRIVIALPVPKQIYASVEGSPPRPADTGEALGDYTLYTATGFFGALERGHLGVRR